MLSKTNGNADTAGRFLRVAPQAGGEPYNRKNSRAVGLSRYRDIDALLGRYMPRMQSLAEDRYERKKYTEMSGHCLIQIPSWLFGINWFPR